MFCVRATDLRHRFAAPVSNTSQRNIETPNQTLHTCRNSSRSFSQFFAFCRTQCPQSLLQLAESVKICMHSPEVWSGRPSVLEQLSVGSSVPVLRPMPTCAWYLSGDWIACPAQYEGLLGSPVGSGSMTVEMFFWRLLDRIFHDGANSHGRFGRVVHIISGMCYGRGWWVLFLRGLTMRPRL